MMEYALLKDKKQQFPYNLFDGDSCNESSC